MVHLTDFCEDGLDDVKSISDARVEWPVGVAVAVLELGLSCMAGIRRRAVKQRPSVVQCIDTVKHLMVAAPITPPKLVNLTGFFLAENSHFVIKQQQQ